MYKIARPFFMVVETPLHAGSGTDLGIVDMPIQRERHTAFPKIEASGLKGCIRDAFKNERKEIIVGDRKINDSNRDETISDVFGSKDGEKNAGALGLTDARLLLFPVKSAKGIFAWTTCRRILERFKLDQVLSGIENIPKVQKENIAPRDCQLFVTDGKIVLEEYTFEIEKEKEDEGECSVFAKWLSENIFPDGIEYNYWREKIKRDIVVLSDDDFTDFVNLSTEVITRIRINNETGTVEKGALFTEEYLPTETILYSLALATPILKKNGNDEKWVMDYFVKGLPGVIQIGGNATIGKGIVGMRVWRNNDEQHN